MKHTQRKVVRKRRVKRRINAMVTQPELLALFYLHMAQNGITGEKTLSIPEEAFKHLPPQMEIKTERRAGIIHAWAVIPKKEPESNIVLPDSRIIIPN